MPVNHLVSLDSNNLLFKKEFEELLNSLEIPFSSQPTKDGEVYTIHFQSNENYSDFRKQLFFKAPILMSLFEV